MNNSPYLAYYDFYDKIAKQAANGNEYVLTEDIEQLKEITTKTISEDAANLILNANALVASVVWLKPLFGWKSNDDLPFKTYGGKKYATMRMYNKLCPSFINDNLSFVLKLIEHKIINVVDYSKQTRDIKFVGKEEIKAVDFLVNLGDVDLKGIFCNYDIKNEKVELYCALMSASAKDSISDQRKEYLKVFNKHKLTNYIKKLASLTDEELLTIPQELLDEIKQGIANYNQQAIGMMTKHNLEEMQNFLKNYIEGKKTQGNIQKQQLFSNQYIRNVLSLTFEPLIPTWEYHLDHTLKYIAIYGRFSIPVMMKYQVINAAYKEWCEEDNNISAIPETDATRLKDVFWEYVFKYEQIKKLSIVREDVDVIFDNRINKNSTTDDSKKIMITEEMYIINGEYALIKKKHELTLDLETNVLGVMQENGMLLTMI
ncbi:MAG: hypothetical protein ACRC17_11050 [Culicoidibacterales bacterium]